MHPPNDSDRGLENEGGYRLEESFIEDKPFASESFKA